MSNRSKSISQITNASESVSRYELEANEKSLCAGNRSYYKIFNGNGNGTVTYTNVLPLRDPCCYLINFKLAGISNNGNILAIESYRQVNLIGGVFNFQAGTVFLSQSVAGNGFGVAKTPGVNGLDVSITCTLGGTVAYTVDIEVINSVNF